MSKYGTYAIKFEDGTYMNKGHGKTKNFKNIHRYTSPDSALYYNRLHLCYGDVSVSIVQFDENETEILIWNPEQCKNYYDTTLRQIAENILNMKRK